MPDQPTLAQRVSSSFAKLSIAAADLNEVSDEVGKSVADIDAALKKLNLGISVWVRISGWEDDGHRGSLAFWTEDLGFAKVKGKWGICLRRVDGNYNYPDDESVEEWPFSDAPRSLRLQSIDKIPELLEYLHGAATKTAREIRGKLPEVQAVATALKTPAKGSE